MKENWLFNKWSEVKRFLAFLWRAAFQNFMHCNTKMQLKENSSIFLFSSLPFQCQTKLTICISQLILKLAPTSLSSKVSLFTTLKKDSGGCGRQLLRLKESVNGICCKFRLTLNLLTLKLLRLNWAGTVMAQQTLLSSCSLFQWVTMLTARVALNFQNFPYSTKLDVEFISICQNPHHSSSTPLPISEKELLELKFSFLLFNAQSRSKKEIKPV